MIHSAEALQRHSGRYGKAVIIHTQGRPFTLGSRPRAALIRLIQAQGDAFLEAESGCPRPIRPKPFTVADLDLLAPLMAWLESL